MQSQRSKLSICFQASACIVLALMLLILPLQWIVAAAVAAAVHELFHIIAVKLCGGKIRKISLGSSGAAICIDPMSPAKELICALAGPMGGISLLLCSRWVPRIAVCAAFQSIYNLMPVYPLDGGRAVHCLLQMLFPRRAETICRFLQWTCLAIIALISVFASFKWKLGILPMLFAAALWYKTKIHLANREI